MWYIRPRCKKELSTFVRPATANKKRWRLSAFRKRLEIEPLQYMPSVQQLGKSHQRTKPWKDVSSKFFSQAGKKQWLADNPCLKEKA